MAEPITTSRQGTRQAPSAKKRTFPSAGPLKRALALLIALVLAACGGPLAGTPSAALPTAVVRLRATPPPTIAPLLSATPTATFTPTPNPTPTPEQPWRFVVLGDTRTEGLRPPTITYQIVEQAARAEPAIVLTVGDMINALDTQAEVRQQWQNWREAVAPLGANPARGEPWLLVTPGNHDVQGHDWATDLLTEAFPELPSNGPPGFARRSYVVDYREVRFISLDSESREALHLLDDAQLDWLEAQLSENARRYTIVYSHDPAYPVGPHIGSSLDAYPEARDRLWRLLAEYRVTAYIAGHEHLYNRQAIDGVQQIIAGTSGSFVYGGFGGDFYHYMVGLVGPDGIEFTVFDPQGAERDRFTLP